MDEKTRVKNSKYMSLVLRHNPDAAGIELDEGGWVDIDVLLAGMAKNHRRLTRDQLLHVVARCEKQRFAISDDGCRIRANQGHSVKVALDYDPSPPPAVLYHGTVKDFLSQIRESGLEKRKRHHVHLSKDVETATKVGSRRGKPIILEIDAKTMSEEGFDFFVTPNGVWLVDAVPAKYIQFP